MDVKTDRQTDRQIYGDTETECSKFFGGVFEILFFFMYFSFLFLHVAPTGHRNREYYEWSTIYGGEQCFAFIFVQGETN